MSKKDQLAKPDGVAWAEFRFSVVGHLLACPPKTKGELKGHLVMLAAKTYRHPLSGGALNVSWHTLERWYYRAKKDNDPTDQADAKYPPCTLVDEGEPVTQCIGEGDYPLTVRDFRQDIVD